MVAAVTLHQLDDELEGLIDVIGCYFVEPPLPFAPPNVAPPSHVHVSACLAPHHVPCGAFLVHLPVQGGAARKLQIPEPQVQTVSTLCFLAPSIKPGVELKPLNVESLPPAADAAGKVFAGSVLHVEVAVFVEVAV